VNERWLEILLTPQRDGISVAAACRRYGISRQSFYEYRRRLWSEGVPALQPRSTRPTTSPSRTASEVEALIVKLRVDNPRWGARTLHTKLVQAGLARPPVVSTIHRVLQRHGLVVAQEHRAPKKWKRFERHAPNDLWQIDGTMVALADGSKAWIVDLLDDHARYAIGATAVRRFTVHAAWKAMDTAITEHGVPRQLISDNGLQFKSRKGQKPVFFQERLAALNIHQLNSRPRHPQTCGKLERYHRTFKEFYADNGPAATIEELQELCDGFRWYYNHERPHRALNQQTPAVVCDASRKMTPSDVRRGGNTGPRVLIVSSSGSIKYRRRRINVGMPLSGQKVRVTEAKDFVTVHLVEEGCLLREIVDLGPVGTYHGNGNKRGRPPKVPQTPAGTPEG
jgi:transposase InsO family protein